jgi:hypothetical protein
MAEFQEFTQQIQQQTMANTTDMSDKGTKCINSQKDSKRRDAKSRCVCGDQQVARYQRYMVGRLSKKGGQQQQQGGWSIKLQA